MRAQNRGITIARRGCRVEEFAGHRGSKFPLSWKSDVQERKAMKIHVELSHETLPPTWSQEGESNRIKPNQTKSNLEMSPEREVGNRKWTRRDAEHTDAAQDSFRPDQTGTLARNNLPPGTGNCEQGTRKVSPPHRHEASPRPRTFSTELPRFTSPKAP